MDGRRIRKRVGKSKRIAELARRGGIKLGNLLGAQVYRQRLLVVPGFRLSRAPADL